MSLTLPKQRRLSESLVGPALRYRTANVNGIKIFDREAGRQEAPDLPGFGQSDMPPRGSFSYTFDNLATVIEVFTAMIRISVAAGAEAFRRDIPSRTP
jgi:hypothetical protein